MSDTSSSTIVAPVEARPRDARAGPGRWEQASRRSLSQIGRRRCGSGAGSGEAGSDAAGAG